MKTVVLLLATLFALLVFSSVAKATVNATCDVASPLGTLSSGHQSGITVPGSFNNISCYPDNSVCVGALQVSATASVPAVLTLINDATSNFTVVVPCGAEAAAVLPNYACATNGNVARDPTLDKQTCKTVSKVQTCTTAFKPWSVRTSVLWDTDTDSAVIKYIDVSNLVGSYYLCGLPVWYVMTADASLPYCENTSDCLAMMTPMAGMPAECNANTNTCFYDPPMALIVPWLCGPNNGDNFGSVIPCATDLDCLPYAVATDAFWNADIAIGGAANSFRTFCNTALLQSETGGACAEWEPNICVSTPCPPGSAQPECAPFEPSGSCTSTCLGN